MAAFPTCSFHLAHYREILDALRRDFSLMLYRDVRAGPPDPARRVAILRHDLDFSIEAALEVARLEHEAGARATYFVRLDARYYNPLHLPNFQGLRRIVDWGHDVGLHYSTGIATVTGERPPDVVRRQLETLRGFLRHDVVVGAPHEPARQRLDSRDLARDAGLAIDAYDPRFVADMKYVSDSAGRWRDGCACEWLDRAGNLTILTHPFWWYAETPLERY